MNLLRCSRPKWCVPLAVIAACVAVHTLGQQPKALGPPLDVRHRAPEAQADRHQDFGEGYEPGQAQTSAPGHQTIGIEYLIEAPQVVNTAALKFFADSL